MATPVRSDNPAVLCTSTKEELLAQKKNPLDVSDDCPICRDDYGTLCRVARHPSTATAVAPVCSSVTVSISQDELVRAFKKAKSVGQSPGALSHSDFAKITESGGFDFNLAPDIPDQQSVLTADERGAMIHNCGEDEHVLIAFMTPVLTAVCAQVGSNYVNSEEEQWIPTLSKDPANFLKPDAFSSATQVYSAASEHRVSELGDLRRGLLGGINFDQVYKFGSPIWDLRDIFVIWEFKWKVSPADRGTAYNYLVNLSRDDAFNTYFVLLCDNEHFYIMSAKNGSVSSIVDKYAWVTRGSVQALQRVLGHKNARQRLLEGLCAQLNVTVTGFLGAGATGRCFSVTGVSGLRALKAVLTCHRDDKIDCASAEALALGEYHKLESLGTAAVPVVRVELGSLHRVYHEDMLLGMGYLMLDVGQPVVPQVSRAKLPSRTLKMLFASLAALHNRGHYHGDARIQNAVFVSGNVVWIDFVWGSAELVGANNNRKKQEDIAILIESIYGEAVLKTDDALKALLAAYGVALDNAEDIAKHVAPLLQRRIM